VRHGIRCEFCPMLAAMQSFTPLHQLSQELQTVRRTSDLACIWLWIWLLPSSVKPWEIRGLLLQTLTVSCAPLPTASDGPEMLLDGPVWSWLSLLFSWSSLVLTVCSLRLHPNTVVIDTSIRTTLQMAASQCSRDNCCCTKILLSVDNPPMIL
jgi:hypothetical protein